MTPIRPPVHLLAPLLAERYRLTGAIHDVIDQAFRAADSGCSGKPGEVDRMVYFFLEGLPALEARFKSLLGPRGVTATVSGIFCHQTPRVKPDDAPPKFKGKACEIGDILFLVTYGRRIYRHLIANGMLVQAKENAGDVQGLQAHLYGKARVFKYATPKALAGQKRNIGQCQQSLWFWSFNAPDHQQAWRTTGWSARQPGGSSASIPFEQALTEMICGINGDRVRALQPASEDMGWSKIVDDLLRGTARAAFRRQNAYISRDKAPLRGEDAICAVNALHGPDSPFLIRCSLARLLRNFDAEMAKLGDALERESSQFDEDEFKVKHHGRFARAERASVPPTLGNERPDLRDEDGGTSFVIMDFSG